MFTTLQRQEATLAGRYLQHSALRGFRIFLALVGKNEIWTVWGMSHIINTPISAVASLAGHYILMVLITVCKIKLCVTLSIKILENNANSEQPGIRLPSLTPFLVRPFVLARVLCRIARYVGGTSTVEGKDKNFLAKIRNLIFINWNNLFLFRFCVINACSFFAAARPPSNFTVTATRLVLPRSSQLRGALHIYCL